MKNYILAAIAVVLFSWVGGAQHSQLLALGGNIISSPMASASFKWTETTHDFGRIPQGKPVTLTYSFTNSGKAPLIITRVVPSCGCTAADFSKDPVKPGKKGFVTITYNAAAAGPFSKSLTVLANTEPGETVLTFTGEVVAEK